MALTLYLFTGLSGLQHGVQRGCFGNAHYHLRQAGRPETLESKSQLVATRGQHREAIRTLRAGGGGLSLFRGVVNQRNDRAWKGRSAAAPDTPGECAGGCGLPQNDEI